MQLNILIGGVLSPTILLMVIDFSNRYSILTVSIQNSRDTVINEKISADDIAHFFRQIASFRQRLQLITIIQTWSSHLPLSLTFQR